VLVGLVSAKHIPFIEERYLSPLYALATLILLELVLHLFSRTSGLPDAKARRGLVMLLVLWLCFPLSEVAVATAGRFKNGAGGYSTKTWRESETVAFAKQKMSANDDIPVYSNGPDALWELARMNATLSPYRTARDLRGRWPTENGSVLVWFKNITWRKYLFSVEELEKVANVVEVARFSDGSIYRVSARRAAAPDLPSHSERVSGQDELGAAHP
jgi:hypothetical protein